jgi:hypothetical protein
MLAIICELEGPFYVLDWYYEVPICRVFEWVGP